MFDRLYVIHCKRLRQRRVHMEEALTRLGGTPFWMTDFDPPEISREIWRERVTGKLTKGEVSVYLKHLATFRNVVDCGAGLAFVLEDDAVFPADFGERFGRYRQALPHDFDLAFFGASGGAEIAPLPGNPHFGREHGSRSVSGFLVTGTCARLLRDELDRRPIAKQIDLTINDIVRERGLVVYWSVPALIENGTETGLFPHSLGVRWRKGGAWSRLVRRVASTARRRLR